MSISGWLARPRVLVGLALAALAGIAGFQCPASPAASAHYTALAKAPPPDERIAGYRPDDLRHDFQALGPQGLRGYVAYRVLDLFFPWLLCGLVGAVLVRLEAAALLPLCALAAGVDTAENAALGATLLTRDALAPALVAWASALTQWKFAAYSLMGLALLVAGLRRAWLARRYTPGGSRR